MTFPPGRKNDFVNFLKVFGAPPVGEGTRENDQYTYFLEVPEASHASFKGVTAIEGERGERTCNQFLNMESC